MPGTPVTGPGEILAMTASRFVRLERFGIAGFRQKRAEGPAEIDQPAGGIDQNEILPGALIPGQRALPIV
jgi:hypothetical protein